MIFPITHSLNTLTKLSSALSKIKGWYRKLVARKFDGFKSRRYPGRRRIDDEIEQLVVRMAKENSDWGYDPPLSR